MFLHLQRTLVIKMRADEVAAYRVVAEKINDRHSRIGRPPENAVEFGRIDVFEQNDCVAMQSDNTL